MWKIEQGTVIWRVEVISRQAGPPVLWLKNWERDILNAVAANLTREAPTATGATGASSYTTTGSGTSVTVPPGTSVTTPSGTSVTVAPPGTPSTTLVTPAPKTTADYIAEQQRKLDDLRREEDLRLKELEREKDVTQREKLTAEIERLRGELRTITDRIAQLELQQKQLK